MQLVANTGSALLHFFTLNGKIYKEQRLYYHAISCCYVVASCGSLALLSRKSPRNRRPAILLHADGGSLALPSLCPPPTTTTTKDVGDDGQNDSRPMILLHANDLALAPLSSVCDRTVQCCEYVICFFFWWQVVCVQDAFHCRVR